MILRMLLLINRVGLETCGLETCDLVDKLLFVERVAMTLQC